VSISDRQWGNKNSLRTNSQAELLREGNQRSIGDTLLTLKRVHFQEARQDPMRDPVCQAEHENVCR